MTCGASLTSAAPLHPLSARYSAEHRADRKYVFIPGVQRMCECAQTCRSTQPHCAMINHLLQLIYVGSQQSSNNAFVFCSAVKRLGDTPRSPRRQHAVAGCVMS
jgi:hypothetical protein